MATQLFVPKFRIEETLLQIKECLEKGWTGLGYKTLEIESQWSSYTGHRHSHFLSSNTVGLHLAVELFKRKEGWSDGDEIITTPLTFISTNHAILYSNLRPVFADVDEYLCLDPEEVVKKITARTRAVIFVGIGGNLGQYERIREICDQKGLKLILDAAHMSGTRVRGKHVGLDSDAAIYSYQAVKNMPTADSGMICFKEAEDDERARKLTWLGINKDTYTRSATQGAYKWLYEVEELGYKYHGNSIMAAMALVSLKYLDRDNSYRRDLAKWYTGNLMNANSIRIVPTVEGCESSHHLFQIRVKQRDALLLALNEEQIYPGVHYRDNTEYKIYSSSSGSCPNAAKASREIISLPMHMDVTKSDVDHICRLILQYAK